MKILRILVSMIAFCSGANMLGMETPNKSGIPTSQYSRKKINSNYRPYHEKRNKDGDEQGKYDNTDYIKNLLNTDSSTFLSTLDSLKKYISAYAKLYTTIGSDFKYLDELLYTIGSNPNMLNDCYTNEDDFFIFKETLFILFQEAYKVCTIEHSRICKKSNPKLYEYIAQAITLSEEILRNFSWVLVDKVHNAYKDSKRQNAAKYLKERKPKLDLLQSYRDKANKISNKRSSDFNDLELYIKATIGQINKLNQTQGMVEINAAFNEFFNLTDCLFNNRCWNKLGLGCLDPQMLIDFINDYEENEAIKELIRTLHAQFMTANEHLRNEFMRVLQNYLVLAFSGDNQKIINAKGFLWESAVSGFLLDTYGTDLINLGNEVFKQGNKHVSCSIDQELTNCYIECKNTWCLTEKDYYSKQQQLNETLMQLEKERDIAHSNGKSLIVISRLDLSANIQNLLSNKGIFYIFPKNCTSGALGDVSKLYRDIGNIK
ncbi:hypothetical protein H0W26_06115 [Candidatus Dependentiae bacterium]|nr:hypothetical protein [Candidatus Dependentiae bacterium]